MNKALEQARVKAKILQIFYQKVKDKSKNERKERRLIYKIKPNGINSAVLVKHEQVLKHFPYTLIEFYESKMNIKQTQDDFDGLVPIIQQTHQQGQYQSNKLKQKQIKQSIQSRLLSSAQNRQQKKQEQYSENCHELMLDYDSKIPYTGSTGKPGVFNDDQDNAYLRRPRRSQSVEHYEVIPKRSNRTRKEQPIVVADSRYPLRKKNI